MATLLSTKTLFLISLPLLCLIPFLYIMKSQDRCSNKDQDSLDHIMKIFKEKGNTEQQEVAVLKEVLYKVKLPLGVVSKTKQNHGIFP